MIRLFIRFSLVTLGAAFASALVLMIFYESAQESFIKPRTMQEMDSLAALLQERLRGVAAKDAQVELDKMAKTSGFRGQILQPGEWTTSERDGVFLKFKGTPYLIEVTTNETVIQDISVLERMALLAAMAAMFGLSVGSGLFLAIPLVRKLHRQEKILLRIADGDLTARVAVGSRDALGRLGERINSMAERIQELVQSHRELIGTISHEMRTPVARLQFSLEMLDESDGHEQRTRIASMQEDIEELDELLEEILTFQRLEAGTQLDHRENVDLLELLDRITKRVAGDNADIAVRIANQNAAGESSLRVCCHERFLTRAIENVVRNAIRFAREEVVVSWEMQAGLAIICVVDDGPGVPPQDRQQIFEPFVTLTNQSDGTATTGLGLAIARHIIRDHGGMITVEDHPSGGALFKLTVPRAHSGS